jgi:hypothetical protein
MNNHSLYFSLRLKENSKEKPRQTPWVKRAIPAPRNNRYENWVPRQTTHVSNKMFRLAVSNWPFQCFLLTPIEASLTTWLLVDPFPTSAIVDSRSEEVWTLNAANSRWLVIIEYESI